jgi:opacity protein-like surface antigen
MKQKFTFIVIIVFLFSISSQLYSQPKFLIHFYGGLSVPLPQLQGDVAVIPIATTFEKDYGMRLGINFGTDAKYAFDKKGCIRGVLSLGYNMFMNPGEYVSATGNYKYKPIIGIFTASLGAEYAFQPKEKWSPFVGVDFTANFFSGSFNYDPKFPTIPDISLKSETRFGLQFGAGADFSLSKSIGIIAGFKYHLANLIGKDSDTSTFSQILPSERPLNDAEYTYGGKTVSAKNISYVQIYSGLTIYFGQPKKVVKKLN